MKTKTVVLSSLVVSLFMSGCISSYGIKPIYDEQKKVVNIVDYPINNVVDFQSEKIPNNEDPKKLTTIVKIKTTNNSCDYIFYKQKSSNSESAAHLYKTSFKDDILDAFNGQCKVENISDVYFLECSMDKARKSAQEFIYKDKNFAHLITTSVWCTGKGYLRAPLKTLVYLSTT